MMKTSIIFYMMMIVGTIITVSSENWMSMWMGLEINMMSFIPLINLKPSKSSSEASMIYFLIQSISSVIMLGSVILIMNNYMVNKNYLILTISILMKMGSAPFHLWLPKMMTVMSWENNIIFMTWQKISPLYMINMLEFNYVMNLTIILSTLVGGLGGLYQTSLRKIMAYSSISHLGWIMAMNKMKDKWLIYLIIYSFMVITMCNYFFKKKLLFINQLFDLKMNFNQKINMMIMMLSMGGMPPMLGFLPKWIVIEEMINSEMFMITIMIMTSMLTLYYYLRIMFKIMMIQSTSNKWTMFNMEYSNFMFIINMLLPIVVLMY
uniref:NADH-ubiquinone oxidoreductase chain 2 n=1 Tax=Urostylis flavoannulata TaxID=2164054 RepID=A0A343W956_9HEMI|nr:NADH dehydrogenase subunit 2 [Urostylis flavoannulata]AVZ00896.1 NADH dehydrogenase subunit 2 [Urostylis flavoannulata]